MTRAARVLVDGEPAGVLEERGEGGTRFTYDASWLGRPDAVPISLTVPLRAEPYLHASLHPFFENLLPEGWLLELSTAKLKRSKDDVFGLLIALCRDCVGAVSIEPFEDARR